RKIAATTTSPIRSRLPNPSDIPKCDINAARPRPAAIPAIGPSQRDAPDGAGVGAAPGAAFAAPAATGVDGCGCVAALPAGVVGAGAGRDGVMLSRWA